MNIRSTIRYVEDDYDDVMIISYAFQKYADQLNVIDAKDGSEALRILKVMSVDDKLRVLL